MKKSLILGVLLMAATSMMAQLPTAQQHNCSHSCGHACNHTNQSSCSQQQKAQAYPSVDVETFAKQVQQKNVVVVDVRTAKEYADGHLEDAVLVEWGNNFDKQVTEKLANAKGKTLAVYCRSGKRSKLAATRLAQLGYKVCELNEGINGWTKAGKKVVKN